MSNRRTPQFTLFLALTLVGFGAWALLYEEGHAPPLVTAAAQSTAVATVTKQQQGSPEEDRHGAIQRVDSAPPIASNESAESSSKDLATFQLTIIDGITQQPIPFAEVHEIREESVLRFQRILQRAKSSDWVHASAELLRLHKANKDGVLQLTARAENESRSLFALHEGQYGISSFRIEAGKQERLELWPDQSWSVLCLSDIGQPLEGFPVALRMWLHNRESPWFPVYSATNANGIAALAHIQHTARYANEADAFKVVPKIPMREDVGVKVDIQSPPSTPVTLQLPPLGTFDVVVLDAEGQPLIDEFELRVAIDPAPTPGRSIKELKSAFRTDGQPTFSAPGNDGSSTLPFVGLGLDFIIQVQPLGGDAFWGIGKGPQRSGETATAQVQQPKRSGFAMRLLNEQKQPLANAPWSMNYRIEKGESGRSRMASGETDENGNTFLDADLVILDFLVDATESKFEITCNTQSPAQIFYAIGSLPTHQDAADKGLGDLMLAQQQVIDLHCTVMDLQGQPVENAWFYVQEEVIEGGVVNWQSLGSVSTNSKGEFHYFQRLPKGRTRYGLSAKGFLGQMENGLPENGAELSLSRGAHISGTITLQDWMKNTSVYLMKRPSNTPEVRWIHAGYLDTKTGVFKLEALRPEPVDLALRTGFFQFHLATMNGVTPWKNEANADGRLAPWTPTPTPQLFQFDVLDANGETISGVTVLFPGQTILESKWPMTLRPENRIVLPVNVATAKVLAPGFRSVTIEAASGVNQVRMQRGLTAQLQLQNPPFLEPGVRIGCEFFSVSRSGLGHKTVVSSWQELTFICSDPGDYTVRIVMIPKGEEPWLESSVTIVEQAVEVLDQENEQVILLELQEQ